MITNNAYISTIQFKHISNNPIILQFTSAMNIPSQEKVEKAFAKARQLSSKGEKYQEEANYQNAAKCYNNVTIILRAIVKETKNLETIEAIKQKIEKYTVKAVEMAEKQKQEMKVETKIKHFGFPEYPARMSLPIIEPRKFQPVVPKVKPNTEKIQVDSDVVGLVAKDIKNSFSDIIGMSDLKQILYEAVIIPQKRPDLFEGIRSPPRGILLYGPPGNGKTFITKALAKQSGCTFFGLSAGSIVNKFVGESEKTLRKVFEAAKKSSPAIIFIDEIDSMLTARSQSDNDAARRLKTEFLIQFDSLEGSRVLVIGATNLPNQLDLAALRRFNKLVYVGMPDKECRRGIVQKTLKDVESQLSNSQLQKLVKQLDGYSASQITDIVKQASMMPIRDINKKSIQTVHKSKIRPVKYEDFNKVLKLKKPLLSKQDLKKYEGKFK